MTPAAGLAGGQVEDVGGDRAARMDRAFRRRRRAIWPCSLGGDRPLGLRVVGEAGLEQGEHLAGRLARGADDEDVAEPGLVRGVPRGQGLQGRLVGRGDARLLPLGPGGGRGELRAEGVEVADPRVGGEGFEVVGRVEPVPASVGGVSEVASDSNGRSAVISLRPPRRAAAAEQGGPRLGAGNALSRSTPTPSSLPAGSPTMLPSAATGRPGGKWRRPGRSGSAPRRGSPGGGGGGRRGRRRTRRRGRRRRGRRRSPPRSPPSARRGRPAPPGPRPSSGRGRRGRTRGRGPRSRRRARRAGATRSRPRPRRRSPESRCLSPGGAGEWSVPMVSIRPERSPSQSASRLAADRIGGAHLNRGSASGISSAAKVR